MEPRAVIVLLVWAGIGGCLELGRTAVPPAAAGTQACVRRLRGGEALASEDLSLLGGSLFAEPDDFFEPTPLPGNATYRGPSGVIIELVTASRSPLWVRTALRPVMRGGASVCICEQFQLLRGIAGALGVECRSGACGPVRTGPGICSRQDSPRAWRGSGFAVHRCSP